MEQCKVADEHAFVLRWKEALAAYDRAMRSLLSAPLTQEQRSRAWECALRWAAAAGEAGKDQEEVSAYGLALSLDAARDPEPRHFSPKIIAGVQHARTRRAQQKAAAMTVTGSPAGAEVWLDTRFVGRMPLSLSSLTPGKHALLVRQADHDAFAGPVSLRAEDTARIEIFLQPTGSATSSKPVVIVVPSPSATPPPATPARTAVAPVLAASAPVRALVHPGASWLPLGIAQFLEHRPVAGALLLATQVALLVTNLTCYGLTLRDKGADGLYGNPARSEALKWVVNGTFIALGIDVIAGGIDGIVHRND